MSLLPISQLVDESTFGPDGILTPDATGRRITGARVVVEWIVRSWLQVRGGNRLAPNIGGDVRRLENATLDKAVLEAWRVTLVSAAKAATIGYLAAIDVTISFADRTTTIEAVAVFFDGSRHALALALGAVGAQLKFGGTL